MTIPTKNKINEIFIAYFSLTEVPNRMCRTRTYDNIQELWNLNGIWKWYNGIKPLIHLMFNLSHFHQEENINDVITNNLSLVK